MLARACPVRHWIASISKRVSSVLLSFLLIPISSSLLSSSSHLGKSRLCSVYAQSLSIKTSLSAYGYLPKYVCACMFFVCVCVCVLVTLQDADECPVRDHIPHHPSLSHLFVCLFSDFSVPQSTALSRQANQTGGLGLMGDGRDHHGQ